MTEETWVKSSFCNSGTCVEVMFSRGDNFVFMRDQDNDLLCFDFDEWEAFVRGVKAGEFDV